MVSQSFLPPFPPSKAVAQPQPTPRAAAGDCLTHTPTPRGVGAAGGPILLP